MAGARLWQLKAAGVPVLMVQIVTSIIRHNRQRSRTADATLMAGLTNCLSH